MSARVEEVVEQAGVISGVRYRANEGHREIRARLVVGADGRFSRVRELAHLRSKSVAQPIDILWFQLPRQSSDPPTDGGLYVGNGALTFIRNRGNVWQVACLLPKGAYQHIKRVGLEPVRDSVAEVVPWLADRTCVLSDWSQTSLLVVESSRVVQWHRPGLLVIGDAAHVMSPVGGVGINLAIQDAVAAAKLLGPRLKTGTLTRRDLALIQRRRELPTRVTQLLQDLFLQYVLSNAATSGWQSWLGRAAEHTPVVRRLRTRLFAFGGLHPERLMQGSVRFPAY
jgi:2-polyprenyl-6-methoxyphenol hydroxylase-like FAD-dependent oxidoreductase